MSMPYKRIFRPCLSACLLLATTTVVADHGDWRERDSDYDLARQAVSRGEVLPLQEVRDHLQRVTPGRIVATRYEFEFGRWVYEFKIVNPRGQLRKVHIDAHSGELVMISDR